MAIALNLHRNNTAMRSNKVQKAETGIVTLLACIAASTLLVLGCSKSQTTPTVESKTKATSSGIADVDNDSSSTELDPYKQHREIENSLIVGLDADMSSGSAQAGLAIERGIILAVEEINASGGLLGRPVELVVRDHRGNPDRGVDNIVEFAEMSEVLAVVGGLHTPVALRELKTIHDHQMIYLGPWAAGTPIVRNEYSPNYVYRVSVRDEYAGGFLVDRALERGINKIGLLLERTGWGRSNEVAMQNALKDRDKDGATVEWFNLGEKDLSPQIDRLVNSGAECVVLVCNPIEGKIALKAMAEREAQEQLPILSHWGITGGDFAKMTEELLPKVDLSFLQTYSFIHPKNKGRSQHLYDAYAARFDNCHSPQDVFSPAGTAHAYEIVMMLADAVKKSDTIERPAIRNALEDLGSYRGVIRDYTSPFTPEHHDALTADDFIMARFGSNGAIVPIKNDGN